MLTMGEDEEFIEASEFSMTCRVSRTMKSETIVFPAGGAGLAGAVTPSAGEDGAAASGAGLVGALAPSAGEDGAAASGAGVAAWAEMATPEDPQIRAREMAKNLDFILLSISPN
jgi:hypothetical protein